MIAVKRLQSLIWVLLVALGALGAYLVSLKVATERNELIQGRMQIAYRLFARPLSSTLMPQNRLPIPIGNMRNLCL